MANVPQHFEARRHVFQLFADRLADAATQLAAVRAGFVFVGQIVFDVDPRQVVRQRMAAVLMLLLDAARDELFTGFGCDTRFVQRQLIDALAKEQQLARIERLVLGTIEAPEQRGGRGFDGFLHGLLDGGGHGYV
jgi:hypothetical protein